MALENAQSGGCLLRGTKVKRPAKSGLTFYSMHAACSMLMTSYSSSLNAEASRLSAKEQFESCRDHVPMTSSTLKIILTTWVASRNCCRLEMSGS